MSKTAAVQRIRHAAQAGAQELQRHGMSHASHAMAVVGNATAAIGAHVSGWTSGAAGTHVSLGGHKKRRKGKAKAHKKHHRKSGSRKRRSPAQMRAFRKMLAGAKRARKGKRGRRRK